MLLAAACYSRGSERFGRWLDDHRLFGPTVRAWREYGAIPGRTKVVSVVALVVSVVIVGLRLGLLWGIVAAALAPGVLAFLLTRPSSIPDTARN